MQPLSITRFEKRSQPESSGAVLWLLLCLCPATIPWPLPQPTHRRRTPQLANTQRCPGQAKTEGWPCRHPQHRAPTPSLPLSSSGQWLGAPCSCSPWCTYRISRHRARRAGAGMAGRPQPLPTPTAALGPPRRCPVCPQASSNRFWRKILSWLCRTAYGREGELGGVLQSCSTRRRSPINLPQ